MKIAVLDDYLGLSEKFADWGELAPNVTVFRDPIGPEALVATLRPFEILCVMRERTPLPGHVIEALPNLRLIVTTGMRNGSIDVATAQARGIAVCGTASRTTATSHLAMTLILAAVRNLGPQVAALSDGGWQGPAGRDLHGLTLGLIGLGRLGARVAELARPFGVRLMAWSENLTDARCAEVGGITRMATLHDLLREADVASIHLVLSERTRGLLGAAEFAKMKPEAVLVNTSRGPIINTDALLAALRSGKPGCAALDVFDEEPLSSNHPLRDTDLIATGKLLLTPHIGYGALQTYDVMYRETVEDLRAWMNGSPVRELRSATKRG
jgi:phosphoglycerate dehydrogenase-like enzyme